MKVEAPLRLGQALEEIGRERGLLMDMQRSSCDGERGYLRDCCFCWERIYMLLCNDGVWRPFESWVSGNAAEGEWSYHDCSRAPHRKRDAA